MPKNVLPIVETLETLANVLISIDADRESERVRYTKDDAMNALHIFSCVCSNIGIHRMIDEKLTKEEADKKVIRWSDGMRAIFKEMTGIDSKTFYHGQQRQKRQR